MGLLSLRGEREIVVVKYKEGVVKERGNKKERVKSKGMLNGMLNGMLK